MNTRHLGTALLLSLLATASTAVQAQLQGTLFTSPEQRAYLDYLRQDFLARSRERGFDISPTAIPEIPTGADAPEDTAPVVHRLGGIVRLRDGTQRIWLNGQALRESELPEGASLVHENGVPALRFVTDSGTYVLRPGQALEVAGGIVTETYHRPPDAPSVPAPNLGLDTEEANTASNSIAGEEPAQTAQTEEPSAVSGEQATELPPQASAEDLRKLLDSLESSQSGNDNEP